ncbi:MAG: DUF2948 family protein [Rhodospirillaceae bacterium]|jgi:hypothetical protein|nr:DUF2948 family protein [Rhodospirillaceae bacterium]
MPGPLSLRAEDAEDMTVVSACLQDAIVTLGDMAYLVEERRFVLVASRFLWEEEGSGRRSRIHTGVSFDEVTGVRMRGINRRADSGRILELLAIDAEEGADERIVTLVLAGGAEVRLEVVAIRCHLRDFGESWPVTASPRHPVADDS